MPSSILLKKSAVSGNAPTALEFGEVAINTMDGKLFYKSSVDTLIHELGEENVKSANFTASNDESYVVTASATVTNPTPVAGKGYTIFLRAGTLTLPSAATHTLAGTEIRAVYHSGAWSYYAFHNSGSVAISGGTITGITDLAVADGGTGASDAATARTNLGLGTLATQSGTFSGTSSGTNTGDNAVNSLYSGLVSNATHTGDATGSVALTLATVNANVGSFGSATAAPTFTVNAKGLITAAGSVTVTPAIGSVTGLGAGVATFLATPSSVNLKAAVTDETGSGALVFATSPTLVTPAIGAATGTSLALSAGLSAVGAITENGAQVIHTANRATQIFNNQGQAHSTNTDFNAITDFGFRHVQGTTNGPGTGSAQFYTINLGLGSDYSYSQYVKQIAIPRTDASDKYLSMRGRENGTWGSWTKFSAGYSDSAGILQTARTIGGSSFNGSANITSFPAPGAIGGTTPSTGAFTTLTASTSLGVGTLSPIEKLQVNGAVAFNASSTGYASAVSMGMADYFVGSGAGARLLSFGPDAPTKGTFAFYQAGANNTSGSYPMFISSAGNVGIGTTTPASKLEVNGSFAATTKSFVIDHPSKPNKRLQYACLEGPENGVYLRGVSTDAVIELPDYWVNLVHEDSISVVLTPMGSFQQLYVQSQTTEKISVGGFSSGKFSYVVYATRKDVDKLVTEL